MCGAQGEIKTMRLCRNEHVMPLYTSFVVDCDLWLVTPLMDKGAVQCCRAGGCTRALSPVWVSLSVASRFAPVAPRVRPARRPPPPHLHISNCVL